MNNFIEYCRLLHQHITIKEETSEETLDKMDKLWYSFTEEEHRAMKEFNAQWAEHPQWQVFALKIWENLKNKEG